ncbi:hypothetical protein [Vibrio phage pTD1]|uniref:Uncharacterized protein n=1 Tax=Vibrio phage pTD1 TaxID=1938577 RepID=A0A1Q2U2R9_9CAUD|nr:hypothetical protein FDH33_gp049 [Vibrio phage pTD1]BAW98258.1 hypothetical protein [Vibrio phage pTD1]
MPDQDKSMAWSTVQFGTIVGLLIVIVLLSTANVFSSRSNGMSDKTIDRMEGVIKSLQELNEESRDLVKQNRASNLALSQFLEEKRADRSTTYNELMSKYQTEMEGVIPSVPIKTAPVGEHTEIPDK